MRHKKKFKTLGRNKSARTAMFKNLCASLAESGFVITTEVKGKELKKYFEPLLTKAKRELTLANRRALISRLGNKKRVDLLVARAGKLGSRKSGYLRLSRLPVTASDGAKKVRVEIIE